MNRPEKDLPGNIGKVSVVVTPDLPIILGYFDCQLYQYASTGILI